MKSLRVYSRPGCHLCELLIEELAGILRGRAVLDVVDIDSKAEWQAAWSNDIPVVEFAGREVCRHRLDRDAVEAVLDVG